MFLLFGMCVCLYVLRWCVCVYVCTKIISISTGFCTHIYNGFVSLSLLVLVSVLVCVCMYVLRLCVYVCMYGDGVCVYVCCTEIISINIGFCIQIYVLAVRCVCVCMY